MSDDSLLHDSPLEFVQSTAEATGTCEVQSVLPREDGRFTCHCTCGGWDTVVDSQDEGVRLARTHTALTGV